MRRRGTGKGHARPRPPCGWITNLLLRWTIALANQNRPTQQKNLLSSHTTWPGPGMALAPRRRITADDAEGRSLGRLYTRARQHIERPPERRRNAGLSPQQW